MLAKLMLGGALFALGGLVTGSSFFLVAGMLAAAGAIAAVVLSVFAG